MARKKDVAGGKAVVGGGEDFSGLSFEEALGRLEGIVEGMEGGGLGLERLIGDYEAGMRLRRVCLEKLAEAEEKVRVLEESLGGKLSVRSLDEGGGGK